MEKITNIRFSYRQTNGWQGSNGVALVATGEVLGKRYTLKSRLYRNAAGERINRFIKEASIKSPVEAVADLTMAEWQEIAERDFATASPDIRGKFGLK